MSASDATLAASHALHESISNLINVISTIENDNDKQQLPKRPVGKDRRHGDHEQIYSNCVRRLKAFDVQLAQSQKFIEDSQKQDVKKQRRTYFKLITTRTELLTKGNEVFERGRKRGGAFTPNVLDDLLGLTYTELSSPVAVHAARVKKDWHRLQAKLSVPLTFALNQPGRSKMDDPYELFYDALDGTSKVLWEAMKVDEKLPEDLEGTWQRFEKNFIRLMESEHLELEELDQVVETAVRLGNEVEEKLKQFCEEPDSDEPSLTIRRANYATFYSHLERTKRIAKSLTGSSAYHEDDQVSILEEDDRSITGVPPDTLGDSLRAFEGKLRHLRKCCDNWANYHSTSAPNRKLYKQGSESSKLCIETVQRLRQCIEGSRYGDEDEELGVHCDVRIEADINYLQDLATGFCQQGRPGTCTLLDKLVAASSPLIRGSLVPLREQAMPLVKAVLDVEQSWRLVLEEDPRLVPLVDRRNEQTTMRDPTDASVIQHSFATSQANGSLKRKRAISDLSDRLETNPMDCDVAGRHGLCKDKASELHSFLSISKQRLYSNLASCPEKSPSLLDETLHMLDAISKVTEPQTENPLPAEKTAETSLSSAGMAQAIANLTILRSKWSDREDSDSAITAEANLLRIISHCTEMRTQLKLAEGDIESRKDDSSIGGLMSLNANS